MESDSTSSQSVDDLGMEHQPSGSGNVSRSAFSLPPDEELILMSLTQLKYYLEYATCTEEEEERIMQKRKKLQAKKANEKRSIRMQLQRQQAKEKIANEKLNGVYRNPSTLETLIINRSPLVKPAYARKVSKYLVRTFKTEPETLRKMCIALSAGDTSATDCVVCRDDLHVRLHGNEIPLHEAVIRAFRGPALRLKQQKTCRSTDGEVCINPYHYERRAKAKMVRGSICVVYGCNNRSDGSSGLSFFRVPKNRDTERYRAFFAFARRQDLEQTGFLNHHRICSQHFRPEDMRHTGKKTLLLPTAVPTQRCPSN
ncbi:uncharacterized protein LOC129599801 [Paramacrobiotus metropolitanus]|uniref:uncharacterized protein LOC129599801 n=1 Tax=Paramacrobiotus metropolitanus TaxID=2943436 RepID=UPI002445A20D|nr:uncharacterized protein LOC129599801 [Paramacrobiotus metropolitanus]